MRHGVKGRKLGRTASHRAATLRALATSLLRHKKIKTTLAKAKELRTYVEPMITRAKVDSVANRRHIAQFINDKEVVKELFGEVVEKIGDRPGGYTRIVKLGNRKGDAAEMAIIELVDYNDVVEKKSSKSKAKNVEKTAKTEATVEDANVIEETEVSEEVVEEAKDEPIAETEEEKAEPEAAAEEVKAEPEAAAEEVKTEPEADEKSTDQAEDSKKEDK